MEDNNKVGQELGELGYMQQLYQNQYMMLNNSMTTHLQEMQALGAVQRMLENSNMLNNKETLTYAGADVYVKAAIKDSGCVIVGVGANYLVEKSIEEAKVYVSGAIAKKTKLINDIANGRKELQSAIIDISYKIERASR
jgi:prefoldin alpha subunit